MSLTGLPFLLLVLALTTAGRAEELPVSPAVDAATISQTICVPGWTKKIRPRGAFAKRIKTRLIRALGSAPDLSAFVLDHRLPLALGGAPDDPRNLALQPWKEAPEKNRTETCLARAVCAGRLWPQRSMAMMSPIWVA